MLHKLPIKSTLNLLITFCHKLNHSVKKNQNILDLIKIYIFSNIFIQSSSFQGDKYSPKMAIAV